MPEERLRKNNEENRHLQKDIALQHQRPKAVKKTAADSARVSEDRHSSAPAAGRGTKRGRDYDLEKVGDFIPLDQREFASGPRPRGLWTLHRPEVLKQPISWKFQDQGSFKATTSWREPPDEVDHELPQAVTRAREEAPELWNLLAKVKPAPKLISSTMNLKSFDSSKNERYETKGIRLEPTETYEVPKEPKRKKTRGTASVARVSKGAKAESKEGPPQGADDLSITIPPHTLKRKAREALNSERVKKQRRLTDVSRDPTAPQQKWRNSEVISPTTSSKPWKIRFATAGARVREDGTVIHIPDWVRELEKGVLNNPQKPQIPEESIQAESGAARVSPSTSSAPPSKPKQKPSPVATKQGPSSVTSLSTPPSSSPTTPLPSPRLQPTQTAPNLSVPEKPARSNSTTAVPAEEPPSSSMHPASSKADDASTHDRSVPDSPSNQLTGASASSPAEEAFPTPRSSPPPMPATSSPDDGSTNTATNAVPSIENAQTEQSASVSRNVSNSLSTSLSSRQTVTDDSESISPPAAAIRRSGRDKKPTKRAVDYEDFLASMPKQKRVKKA